MRQGFDRGKHLTRRFDRSHFGSRELGEWTSLIQNGISGARSNPGGSFFFFLVGAQIRVDAARFSSILQYKIGFRAFSMGFSVEIASETGGINS